MPFALLNFIFSEVFDWAGLPEDSLVVDVGGGVGTVSTQLAAVHPKLRFVVQDRPAVVEDGKKVGSNRS